MAAPYVPVTEVGPVREMDHPMDARGALVERLPPPNWQGLLSILLLLASEAEDPEARRTAEREMERMARAADFAVPLHSALTLAVPELREHVEAHVRSTTRLAVEWHAEDPLPSTFDRPESEKIARRMKKAFDDAALALALAEGR